MENYLAPNSKPQKPRLRCYSSMNYNEYQDFFGTPPKMPQPPNSKPQEDPLDIPYLSLETEIPDEDEPSQPEPQKEKNIRRIKYNIDVIPEVDSSEANSIGIQSPCHRGEFFKFQAANRMEDEAEDPFSGPGARRQRSRPRSFSQNNLFTPKTRIIDFLRQSKNSGRKQVKLE